jgi:AhpD family alkylhydroperoxidase
MKTNNSILIRSIVLFSMMVFSNVSVLAQGPALKSYEDTKKEIETQFGFFPLIFASYPQYALPSAWENFKQLGSPDSKIPPKYRELIQLAVAAQIPCVYCIYFHTAAAGLFGATDEEIKEAIAQGANTRQWSMILQGNDVNIEAFRKEVDMMLKKMSEEQAKK